MQITELKSHVFKETGLFFLCADAVMIPFGCPLLMCRKGSLADFIESSTVHSRVSILQKMEQPLAVNFLRIPCHK